jgi:hypothetical protein
LTTQRTLSAASAIATGAAATIKSASYAVTVGCAGHALTVQAVLITQAITATPVAPIWTTFNVFRAIGFAEIGIMTLTGVTTEKVSLAQPAQPATTVGATGLALARGHTARFAGAFCAAVCSRRTVATRTTTTVRATGLTIALRDADIAHATNGTELLWRTLSAIPTTRVGSAVLAPALRRTGVYA